MGIEDKKELYIFIDESGNFDFSSSGTKHFVLTSVTTTQPLKGREELMNLRYRLLCDGHNQEYFHATEDKQDVRNSVYDILERLDDVEIDTVIAQKNKTNPSLYIEYDFSKRKRSIIRRSEEKFYRLMSQTLLQYIFRRYENQDGIEKIIVVLGAIFSSKKRGYILKSLKQYLKFYFKKPFYIYFHRSESDINCQLADYCGWAVYVNAERGEGRPLKKIKEKVKSSFDIFQRGSKEYY